jgi:hypothetical protein
MKQYVQTDLEVHRQVATTLAELILGGVLLSGVTAVDGNGGRSHEVPGAHPMSAMSRGSVHKSVHTLDMNEP